MSAGAASLAVAWRDGAPFAAYLALAPRGPRPARSWQPSTGRLDVIVDYDEAGRPLGLEILCFDDATLALAERVLAAIGRPDAAPALAPLHDACTPRSRAA